MNSEMRLLIFKTVDGKVRYDNGAQPPLWVQRRSAARYYPHTRQHVTKRAAQLGADVEIS